MIVRIRLKSGRPIQRKRGKNRHVASGLAALLIPLALMAYVLGLWRLASDMGFAGEFGDTLPQNLLNGNNVPTWVRSFSQELRISTPSTGPFFFTLGGYFDDTTSNDLVDQTGTFGIPTGGLIFRRNRRRRFVPWRSIIRSTTWNCQSCSWNSFAA